MKTNRDGSSRLTNHNPLFRALLVLTALVHLDCGFATAQTQSNACETIIQIGTGMSASGNKLRPGSRDIDFQGLNSIFPTPGEAFVVTNPPAAWIANSASPNSQWIGPSAGVADDSAGVYIYYLPLVLPYPGGSVTGRYAASDRAILRLNGAVVNAATPATGWTTWTPFSLSNLLSGLNRLEFVVTNATPAAGGRAGPTGLRVELTAKASRCDCIELSCPTEIVLNTCSNGVTAPFSVTGTNRCGRNLSITCALASSTGIQVNSNTVFPLGVSTVVCTASDNEGHRTSCSFRVVVRGDSQAPQIRCPSDIVLLCSGAGTNVYFSPQVSDDTDPAPVVDCVPPSGSFFPAGTNRVTCLARDACGNVSRCSFLVVILPNGFTKTLQAGLADNFSPAGIEPVVVGTCLASSGFASGMPFDASYAGRYLAHTFQSLPNAISHARLTLRIAPTQDASQDDVLHIGLQGCGGVPTWSFTQGVASLPGAGGSWNTNGPTTVTLDLAALPGGLNLLAAMNTTQRLDFAIGRETIVDYARLEVTYCGPQGTISGVPYLGSNVFPLYLGNPDRWWSQVNTEQVSAIELDLTGADGYRLNFIPGLDSQRACGEVSQFAHQNLTTVWPTGNGTTATVVFDEPGTNVNRTRVTLDQPSNSIGKMVEVWGEDPVALVSRYFFPGDDATGVTIPDKACVRDMGFTTHYFFIDFTDPQEMDLKAIEVPATQNGGTLIMGQIGPVVRGQTLKLYFNISAPDFGSFGKASKVSWVSNSFHVSSLSLLHDDHWIEAFGLQQLTISDVVMSKGVPLLSDHSFGDCIGISGAWTIQLDRPEGLCTTGDSGLSRCGSVDISMVSDVNEGGLRLTPSGPPLYPTTIENRVATSVENSITVHRASGLETIEGVKVVSSDRWPVRVSGSLGPHSFSVVYPRGVTLSVGNQVFQDAVTVTFHAKPTLFGGPIYKVCVQTESASEFSFKPLKATGLDSPLECLTLDCPTNLIVSTTNPNGTVVSFDPAPQGVTRCGSNVVISCEPPSGSVFPPGVTVVSCSAVDSRGNQAECQFLVTVEVQAPLQVRLMANGELEFHWTGDAVLESTETLADRPAWRRVTETPRVDGLQRVLRLAAGGQQGFYRTRLVSP